MKLTIVGCSPAVPAPGGACSSYLIEEGETRLLVDCGHGALSSLQELTGLRAITAIIISHMHPDHFFDLVPLHYAYRFGELPPVPLRVPPGGVQLLGDLERAVGLDPDFFTSTFDLSEYDPRAVLTDIPRLSVRFAPTQHFISGFALSIEPAGGGRALFFSSDTAYTDELVAFAHGASLGLLEATLEAHQSPGEVGHMSGRQAGQMAREAGVERLVLTHYWPDLGRDLQDEAFQAFRGPVELAVQGETYQV